MLAQESQARGFSIVLRDPLKEPVACREPRRRRNRLFRLCFPERRQPLSEQHCLVLVMRDASIDAFTEMVRADVDMQSLNHFPLLVRRTTMPSSDCGFKGIGHRLQDIAYARDVGQCRNCNNQVESPRYLSISHCGTGWRTRRIQSASASGAWSKITTRDCSRSKPESWLAAGGRRRRREASRRK
jgi:hypothetical protein